MWGQRIGESPDDPVQKIVEGIQAEVFNIIEQDHATGSRSDEINSATRLRDLGMGSDSVRELLIDLETRYNVEFRNRKQLTVNKNLSVGGVISALAGLIYERDTPAALRAGGGMKKAG